MANNRHEYNVQVAAAGSCGAGVETLIHQPTSAAHPSMSAISFFLSHCGSALNPQQQRIYMVSLLNFICSIS